MEAIRRVQIHQYNDPETIEFFNARGVVGDHLFVIRGRRTDLAAGPGDWLVVAPDGELEVKRGDHAGRSQRANTRAKNACAGIAAPGNSQITVIDKHGQAHSFD